MMPSVPRITDNFHHIHSRTFHEVSHHRSFRLNDLNDVEKGQVYTLKVDHDMIRSYEVIEVRIVTGASA